MINIRFCFWLMVVFCLLFTACGKQESASDLKFQVNSAPSFVLTDVFEGEGALEDAWDSADGKVVNEKLNEMITGCSDEFETFSYATSDLLQHESQPVANLLGTDLRKLVARLIDEKESFRPQNSIQNFYSKPGETYMNGFYSLLEKLSEDDSEAERQYLNEIINRIISYYILPENNTPAEIGEDMQEIIDTVLDDDFHGDFTDLTEAVAKLLIRSDYSLYVNGSGVPLNPEEINISSTDLHLGNVVRGVNSLMQALNELMINPESRELIHNLILETAKLFDPDPASDNAEKVKTLVINLETQFTTGGAQFQNGPIYNTDNAEIFSGEELHGWTRDLLPPVIQYLMRGDRPNSLISDKWDKKAYPVDILVQNLKSMEWDTENARIEESIYDLLRFDLRGRDRVSDPDASHTSFLENLIFFSALGANFGFSDGGVTGEITVITDPNNKHGHGEGVGKLTLNDVLFSMKTTKTLDLLGMYDLAFADTNKDNIFRSKDPFTISNRNDNRFYYDQNYAIGQMLSGTPGDMGSPDGGINPIDNSGEPVLNAYRPYCPTGVSEDNIALNTMSGSMRAAWRAEGPYYYAPENPPTINLDGKEWEIFYTPGGKIYAYVFKPTSDSTTWQYTYPAQFDGQAMEDNAFSIIRPNLTHSLFTSSVDLTGGVTHPWGIPQPELRIIIGDTSAPVLDTTVILPQFANSCSRETLMDLINDAVGEDICFPLDSNGKQFVQIITDKGSVTLSNEERNPLGRFLVSGAGNDSSVSKPVNAFSIDGTAVVKIQLDDEAEQTITFGAEENGGFWTVDSIVEKLQSSPIGSNAVQYGKYIKLFGNSSDSALAKVSISNDNSSDINSIETIFGKYGDSYTSYLMRIERYKDIFDSDYYMLKRGGDYRTITTDENGNHQIIPVGSDEKAQALVVEEAIPETEPMRPCISHEEALFRNYQFFFAERRFLLVLPLRLALIGVEMASVFQVMEANGYTGFMYARKFRGNHEWAKKGAGGDSFIPGDYRLEICADVSGLATIAMSTDSIYNDTLGCGTSFSGVLPHNAATIYRMGFPRASKINHGKDDFGNDIIDYQVGSREFEVGDGLWNQRNALLIVLQALWGGLHDHTERGYQSTKGGMLPFFEMTTTLLQPLFYYQKSEGDYPRNCWKPRIVDGHGFLDPSGSFYDNTGEMDTWYGSEDEREYYRPAKVKTVITTLIDSDPYGDSGSIKRCDGLLPMITEYDPASNSEPDSRLVTTLLDTLLKTRDTAFDDPAETDYLAADFDAGWEDWGARRKLYYGIEQIISGCRLTKGSFTTLNETESYKNIQYPNWMFATGVEASKDIFGNYTQYENVRDDDLILDFAIDKFVGHDSIDAANEGYGLAHYPDDKTVDADWKDFYDMADLLEAVLHDSSEYSVTEPLLALLDEILAKPQPYTPDEIAGTLYAFGKLFAYYDTAEYKWYHQGDDPENIDPNVDFNELYSLLSKHLPAIHSVLRDETGRKYYASLVLMKELSKPGGLLEFLTDSVSTSSDWKEIFEDLEQFLGRDIINNYDPMWSSIATLLDDLGRAADDAQDGTLLNSIYEKYGIQIN